MAVGSQPRSKKMMSHQTTKLRQRREQGHEVLFLSFYILRYPFCTRREDAGLGSAEGLTPGHGNGWCAQTGCARSRSHAGMFGQHIWNWLISCGGYIPGTTVHKRPPGLIKGCCGRLSIQIVYNTWIICKTRAEVSPPWYSAEKPTPDSGN
jgi:hypothetical protein